MAAIEEPLTSPIVNPNPIVRSKLITSISLSTSTAEMRADRANESLKRMRASVADSGASILLLHHLRKRNPNPKLRPDPHERDPKGWFNAVRGAGALINSGDGCFGLNHNV